MTAPRTPRVEIEYCTGCRWLLRAGWTAQELLTTFESELAEVALVPGRTAGIFVVRLDGEILFDRADAERFPELRELKQLIRDRVAPDRALGHSDQPPSHPAPAPAHSAPAAPRCDPVPIPGPDPDSSGTV